MLLDSIANIINKNINEYITKLSEKYSLDIDELQALWSEVSGSSSKKKTASKKKKEDSDSENEEKPKKQSKKNVDGGCPYLFIKGKNEGNICGSKPKDGATYCSRHSKHEGVGQKEKKKIPTAKKISEKAAPKEKSSPSQKPKMIIRINKDLDKYWNPESCLVFKSKDERVVIGSYRDEKFEKLNDEDILLCEKYGFKYEKPEVEKKVETKAEKKSETKKVEKKSISEHIEKTNVQAEHIENVLNEICEDKEEEDVEEESDEKKEEKDDEEDDEEEEEYVDEEEMLEEDEE